MTAIITVARLLKTYKSNSYITETQANNLSSLFSRPYNELLELRTPSNKYEATILIFLKNIAAIREGPVGLLNYLSSFSELFSNDIAQDNKPDYNDFFDALLRELLLSTPEQSLEALKLLKTIENNSASEGIIEYIYIKISEYITSYIILTEDSEISITDLQHFLAVSFVGVSNHLPLKFEIETLFTIACNYIEKQIIELDPKLFNQLKPLVNLLDSLMPCVRELYSKKFVTLRNDLKNYFFSNKKQLLSYISRNIKIYESIKSYAKVKIFCEAHNEYGFFAVKEYSKIKPGDYLDSILNEINIAMLVSQRASKTNCFIKVYEVINEENRILICMEYFRDNLKNCIDHWKAVNYFLPEETLLEFMKKMISSFSELEAIKIHHRDIKPQNILITENFCPKIIDFNCSLLRINEDYQYSLSSENPVEGTTDYMAPEIIEYITNDLKTGKFRPGRADVFSLGLTFLQMTTKDKLFKLNLVENHQKLLARVKSIQYSNIVKKILNRMLRLDYHKRKKFSSLLKYFS